MSESPCGSRNGSGDYQSTCLSSGNIDVINRVPQAIGIQIPALGVVESSVGGNNQVVAKEAVEGGVVGAHAQIIPCLLLTLKLISSFSFFWEQFL